MPIIVYPSFSQPPGQLTTTNTTQGGVCVYPDTTRRLLPQQPQGEILPPGRFTTTNTTFGGLTVYPDATRRLTPQQPQGETLPPGKFTSPNTQFGGDVVCPLTTRRLTPQQPQGEILPPGKFAGVTPPVGTGFMAWSTIYPQRTTAINASRASALAGGFVLPPFPPRPPLPPVNISNNKPFIAYDPTIDPRLRRFTQILTDVTNSLFRNGQLLKTGPNSYVLDARTLLPPGGLTGTFP